MWPLMGSKAWIHKFNIQRFSFFFTRTPPTNQPDARFFHRSKARKLFLSNKKNLAQPDKAWIRIYPYWLPGNLILEQKSYNSYKCKHQKIILSHLFPPGSSHRLIAREILIGYWRRRDLFHHYLAVVAGKDPSAPYSDILDSLPVLPAFKLCRWSHIIFKNIFLTRKKLLIKYRLPCPSKHLTSTHNSKF